MKLLRVAAVAAFAVCVSAPSIAYSDPNQTLNGEWIVDLSANPAEPYTQPMRLSLASDGTVTGEFYNSVIEAGRWQTARGRTCVSFRTTDGAGPYYSAACLAEDGVVGQTWAEHREFLFNWSATRPQATISRPQ